MKTLIAGWTLACVLAAYGTASAMVYWVTGTGTATFHDKQSAYDAAYRDAIHAADRQCDAGTTLAASTSAVSYSQPDPTSWTATVTVREICEISDDRP